MIFTSANVTSTLRDSIFTISFFLHTFTFSYIVSFFFYAYILLLLYLSLTHDFSLFYSVLDEDDERILKVMKKVTDSLSLTHLSRTKTFLLSVLQNLQFSSSICTIAISTVFAISKSVARTTSREYKNIGGEILSLMCFLLFC
jgi:hypothetical protein